MDFILHGEHLEHDVSWAIYSSLHQCHVCLGCIVETLEETELLPLQRKPALTEFHRLVTQQSNQLLQLFMKEERIVWHVVSILLESLELEEESYLSVTIDALLKMVQLIGSEELVIVILDKINQQVQITTDHKKLLPHYTLLGKVLYQLPILAELLLRQYDWLLHELSLDLSRNMETVQSAIAYIFIFLCDGTQDQKLAARTLQRVHSGILKMLSSAQSLPVLVNGLGLIKKLIGDENGCHSLVTLTLDGMTFLSCMKKLMLSKKDVLQTGVSQILSLVLNRENCTEYVTAILESDIVEFMFEALHTENTTQIECILKVLQKLSHAEQFYKRCHSVYGVESVLRSLSTAFDFKNPGIVRHGYVLLTEILNRHPADIPLFLASDMVQKCLTLVHKGLGHHQSAVSQAAQDVFYAILRRNYLLSPVPFLKLSEMVTMVTRRNNEEMKTFLSFTEAKQSKNLETVATGFHRYLDICVRACSLLTQCKDDLTSCESNFTAPGTHDDGLSPMATFTELMFDAGENISNLLTVDCAALLENHQLYIKVIELFCGLFNLDNCKTSDLIYELISAGFMVTLIDVKVKFNLAQLNKMVGQFIMFFLECCKQKNLLPIDANLEEQHFKWPFSSVAQVFQDGGAEIDTIEAYLTVLYVSCKTCDCDYRQEHLADIMCSVLNGHVSLGQFSISGKKHYIYLLAYVCVYEGISMRQAIPHGLEDLPQVFQGQDSDWYTHDMVILEWVFGDPVLAGTAGINVVEAFLNNTTLEMMKTLLETEDCVECDIIMKLCENKTFLTGLLKCMATNTIDNITKISLCLEAFVNSCQVSTPTSESSQSIQLEDFRAIDYTDSDQLTFLFNKATEVLQEVFLHHYPNSQDHNIVGFLQLMLLVRNTLGSGVTIGVKVLYHVLNILSKSLDGRVELEESCMLTVKAAVTGTGESPSQTTVSAIVVQHEGFLSYLEKCTDQTHEMYCIACDILTALVTAKSLKCESAVKVEIGKLIRSVCVDSGSRQVASMSLLSALLGTNLASTVVTVKGRIYPNMYRSLHIQLQNLCLQEKVGIGSTAVSCMRNMIWHLHQTDTEMEKEILLQPWNKLLLEVVLDLASAENIVEHHKALLVLFTEFENGCVLIKSTTGLLNKMVDVIRMIHKDVGDDLRSSVNTLIKQVKTKFEGTLKTDDLKWLKEISPIEN